MSCATLIFVVPIALNATVCTGGGIVSLSASSSSSSSDEKSTGEKPLPEFCDAEKGVSGSVYVGSSLHADREIYLHRK